MSTSSVSNNKAGFEKLHQEAEAEKNKKSAKQDQKIATAAAVGKGIKNLSFIPVVGGALSAAGTAIEAGAGVAATVKAAKNKNTTGAVMAGVGAVGGAVASARGVNQPKSASPNSPSAQATVVAQSETQPKAKN